jgi:ADP-ribosylation factor GTPase-activating protein 1
MAHQMERSVQAEIRGLPGNTVCADCNTKNPQWASISFGSMFCLECSGVHRSLGVHISFVRSITMDSWSDKQITMMRLGGNHKIIAWLDQRGIPKTTPIKAKYESPEAELYKLRLKAVAEGTTPPTVLPKKEPRAPYVPEAQRSSSSSSGVGGGGFGNPQYQSFGSQPSPAARGGGGRGGTGGIFDGDNFQAAGGAAIEGLASAWTSFGAVAATVTQTVAENVKEARLGEKLQGVASDGKLVESIKDTTANSWNLLSSSATSLWQKVTTGDDQSGLGGGGSGGGGATARAQEHARMIQEQLRREEQQQQQQQQSPSAMRGGGAVDGFGFEADDDVEEDEDDDEWLRNQLSGGASSVAAAASSSVHAVKDLATESANAMMGGMSLGANAAGQALGLSDPAPAPPVPAPVARTSSTPAQAPKKEATEDDFFASFGVN